MKKMYYLLLLSATVFGLQLSAQTTLLSEDFTTYAGTAGTVPAGWTFSYNGNYTTTASSGTSGPNSYKFGALNATITSPAFVNADTLSFWVKGNGTDTLSTLIAFESADGTTWDTVAKLRPLPTTATGQTYKYAIQDASTYVKFVYIKSVGNCAFDDFLLTRNASGTPLVANFSAPAVCIGSASSFTDLSVSDSGTVASWAWNFGDGTPTNTLQNPTHTYAYAGNYNVQLIVGDNLMHLDTISSSVSVDSVTSSLSATPAGMAVTFSGMGAGGTAPYTYLLDLGDGAGFTATNPDTVYTYSSAGSYTACLISYDNAGCFDTACTSFTIAATGIQAAQNDALFHVSPNPSNDGLFTLSQLSAEKSLITVYNLLGEGLFATETNGNTSTTLDLSKQPQGSYIIRVTTKGASLTQRLIISK